jgi:hypothetical protein
LIIEANNIFAWTSSFTEGFFANGKDDSNFPVKLANLKKDWRENKLVLIFLQSTKSSCGPL